MKPKGPQLLRNVQIPKRLRVFGLGMYHGMRNWRIRPEKTPEKASVQRYESRYALGYAIGTLLQAMIVVAVATLGGEALVV